MFGPKAPFGVILSINPVVVIVLVPIFGALFRKFSAFNVILAGALISGEIIANLFDIYKGFRFNFFVSFVLAILSSSVIRVRIAISLFVTRCRLLFVVPFGWPQLLEYHSLDYRMFSSVIMQCFLICNCISIYFLIPNS